MISYFDGQEFSWQEMKEKETRDHLIPCKDGLDMRPVRVAFDQLNEGDRLLSEFDSIEVRFWQDMTREENIWLKTPLVGKLREGERGHCLGCSPLMQVRVLPKHFHNLMLEIKDFSQIIWIVGIKVVPVTQIRVLLPNPPFYLEEVGEGHALHFPSTGFELFSVVRDVVNPEEWLGKFRHLNGDDDLHLLLYPSGYGIVTNGIAGNATYLVRVKRGPDLEKIADRFLKRKATIGELRAAVKAAKGISWAWEWNDTQTQQIYVLRQNGKYIAMALDDDPIRCRAIEREHGF